MVAFEARPFAADPGADAPALGNRAAARELPVLLFGIALLVLGNGLQGTLLGVRATAEGFSQETIGLIMSAYFAGFVGGSLIGPALIARAGHIRTFAALASLASIATLAHVLIIDPFSWGVFRAANGAAYAGLVMVAESWLNATATRRTRGRILAIYGLVMLGAWSGSQWLLLIADPNGFALFCLVSILISASLIPLSLSRVEAPRDPAPERVGLRRLFAISPLGVAGCFLAGLAMSAFWGLGAVFAQGIGLDDRGTAAFMAATLAGAMALQWPVGWLSDRFDRRSVIAATCLANIVVSLALFWLAPTGLALLVPAAFLFGGLGIPVYSLCLAHANDFVARREVVAASSALLLVYGVGSMIGPLLCGLMMGRLGPQALFLFTALGLFAIAAVSVLRMLARPSVPPAAQQPFVAVPRTTHVSSDLDPRGEWPADQADASEDGDQTSGFSATITPSRSA